MKLTFADLAAPAPDAPDVERQLAFDLVRRGLWVAPAIVLAAGLVWGGDGAWSALVAVAVVLVNLALAAISLSWAARRSLTLLMAVAMGGFLVRMGLVTAVMLAVRNQPWIDLVALGVTVLVTHLGLLFWELRYVSASLAYPALKPGHKEAVQP
ncbi:MAG TPA: ATP synthase subunit I [Acidimicrobiales bacterium]|jgi:hypothetical protein